MTFRRYEVVMLQVPQVCKQERCNEIGQMCQDPQSLLPQHGWLPPDDTGLAYPPAKTAEIVTVSAMHV